LLGKDLAETVLNEPSSEMLLRLGGKSELGGMKRQLLKNSLTGALQSIVFMSLVFTVIPVFMARLGAQQYGIFSAVTILGNLNVLTSLGLTNALVKFLAEQGRSQESNLDILVVLILTASILVPLLLIGIPLNRFVLLKVLNLPPEYLSEENTLYILMLLSYFFLFLGQVFKAILDSLQKVDLNNYLQIVYNFAYWGSFLLLLELGYGLAELGMAMLVCSVIWCALSGYFALKSWGKITHTGLRKEFGRIAKKQISYGIRIYFGGLATFFFEPFTKVLISHYIGTTQVGFFDIAVRIKTQVEGLISKILSPLYPFLASLKDRDKIRLYVHDLGQKVLLTVTPVIVLVVVAVKPFINVWLKQNVEVVSISTILIVSAHLLYTAIIPNYYYLLAHGRAGKIVLVHSVLLVLNILVFFLMYRYIGYYAAVLGNVVSILASFFSFLYFQNRYLSSLFFDSLEQFTKLLSAAALLLGLGLSLNFFLPSNVSRILIDPIVIAAASVFLYRHFGMITREDIARYSGTSLFAFRVGIKLFVR